MKQYFSNDDRNKFMFILASWNIFDDLIGQAKCYDKEELKCMKIARTYMLKFNKHVLARTEDKFKNQVLRQLKNSEIKIMPKSSAIASIGASLDVNEEEYFALCDLAARGCKGCTKCYKDCKTYDTFTKLQVPIANSIEVADDSCPYSI